MLKILMKFFKFCNEENRKKFYKSIALGVIDAIFAGMKIPAAYFAIDAIVNNNITVNTFLLVMGFMLLSTVGKMVINRFYQMLLTEGGYRTCAGKRIEIGEHLRYLPMGYFNDTSLGHITSVTTNTLEQTGDIATRAIILVMQGIITTAIVSLGMFIFDVRIGLICVAVILIFFIFNHFS